MSHMNVGNEGSTTRGERSAPNLIAPFRESSRRVIGTPGDAPQFPQFPQSTSGGHACVDAEIAGDTNDSLLALARKNPANIQDIVKALQDGANPCARCDEDRLPFQLALRGNQNGAALLLEMAMKIRIFFLNDWDQMDRYNDETRHARYTNAIAILSENFAPCQRDESFLVAAAITKRTLLGEATDDEERGALEQQGLNLKTFASWARFPRSNIDPTRIRFLQEQGLDLTI